MTRLLQRELDKLKSRLLLAAGRFILRRIEDGGELMEAQVTGLDQEAHDSIEVMHHYGLTSRPPKGSEGLLVASGGVRSAGVIIATVHRQFRLKLEADGEAALYDDQGQVVHLKRDGLLIKSTQRVDIEAPEVKITGNAIVTGNATVQGNAIVQGNATVDGTTIAKGQVKLGGDNPTKFIMLADGTPSTKVKAV